MKKRFSTATLVTAIVVVVFLASFVAYGLAWHRLKDKTEVALEEVSRNAADEISFRYRVTGFPFAFNIDFDDITAKQPAEDTQLLSAFGFTPNPGVDSFPFTHFRVSWKLFSQSAVMTIPTEMADPSGRITTRYNTAPTMTLSYDLQNTTLAAYALGLRPAPAPEDWFKHFRELHYHDDGSTTGPADGSQSLRVGKTDIVFGVDQQAEQFHATLGLSVHDIDRSEGFYDWYLEQLGTYQQPASLVRDFVAFAADYPVHDGPVTFELAGSATVPQGFSKDDPRPVRLRLDRFLTRDKLGEARHSADLTISNQNGRPLVSGNYTMKVEHFPQVLARYRGFVSAILKYAYDHQDAVRQYGGEKTANFRVPDPVWVDTFLPQADAKLRNFLAVIGALNEETLILTLEKRDATSQPMLNGLTAEQLAPLAQQYIAALNKQTGAITDPSAPKSAPAAQ